MESYIKGEISITAEQLASAKAHIQKELREAVWSDGWDGLLSIFDEAFDEALTDILDIEWGGDAMAPDFNRGRLITGPEYEGMELNKLQKDIWQKRVTQGCSVSVLNAVIDELLKASLAFLGIKVSGAAAQERGRDRARLRAA